jgi:DNA-binding MarR family transcriptional regulator
MILWLNGSNVKKAIPSSLKRALKELIVSSFNRIQLLTDLVGLEIELWNRIEAKLRQDHDLSLAFFEVLFFICRSPVGKLSVGDLAQAIHITVGGCSKLVDRVEAVGLIVREAAADDRRASHIALTTSGQLKLAEASKTCESEMAILLETLGIDDQQLLHNLITRLLGVSNGA